MCWLSVRSVGRSLYTLKSVLSSLDRRWVILTIFAYSLNGRRARHHMHLLSLTLTHSYRLIRSTTTTTTTKKNYVYFSSEFFVFPSLSSIVVVVVVFVVVIVELLSGFFFVSIFICPSKIITPFDVFHSKPIGNQKQSILHFVHYSKKRKMKKKTPCKLVSSGHAHFSPCNFKLLW